MTTKHVDMFDHTIGLTRVGRHWHAEVWRSTYDERGVIVGSVCVAHVTTWTQRGAQRRARSIIRRARKRGARWPNQHLDSR